MKKYIVIKCGFAGFLLGLLLGFIGMFGLPGIIIGNSFYYISLWWLIDYFPLGELAIITAPLILIGIWTVLGIGVGIFLKKVKGNP